MNLKELLIVTVVAFIVGFIWGLPNNSAEVEPPTQPIINPQVETNLC